MPTTLCLKKRPTFKLSLTLSNLNRFSKLSHCWKACKNFENRSRFDKVRDSL